MTAANRPKDAEALAALMKEEAPASEDLLRIERSLARELRARKQTSPRRGMFALGLGSLAVAAAAALFFVWGRGGEQVPVLASVERGDVISGGHEAQLGHAHLEVAAGSSVRIDETNITRAALTLTSGEVHVAFHPEHRGEEHLAVLTPAARVDVVGTEFVVSIEPSGGTRVVVTEGIVRVTPTSGEAATLVRAGSSIDVALAIAAVVEEPSTTVEVADAVVEAPAIVAEVHAVEGPRTAEEPSTVEESSVRARSTPTDPPRVVDRSAEIARLEGESDRHAHDRDHRGVIESTTQILELDPHGLNGANALFERAQAREALGDPAHARADYERYLAEHPTGSFAAQARTRLTDLASFPSAP